MLLADIGNTHIHIWDNQTVVHLSHAEALKIYGDKDIQYISVNQTMETKIAEVSNWKNISSSMIVEGAYETMGVDRRALCLSRKDGIFVDAGSAITMDVMRDGVYQGGFILPGVGGISEVLLRHFSCA